MRRSSEIEAFLGNTATGMAVKKGESFNVTSVEGGSYMVPNDRFPAFRRLIWNDLFQKNQALPYTESPTFPVSGLRVDIDCNYDHNYKKHLHTDDHIEKFVKAWMTAIQKVLDVGTDPVMVIAMQKARPVAKVNKNDIFSDGLHFQIPNVSTTSEAQLAIRALVLPHLEEIFGDIPIIRKSWDDVYDKQVYGKQQWMIYGCSKPNGLPYLAHLRLMWNPVDGDFDEITTLGEAFNNSAEVMKLMSIRHDPEDDIEWELTPEGQALIQPAPVKAPQLTQTVYQTSTLWNEEVDEICAHVLNITNGDDTPYDVWYKVAQALFNLGAGEPKFWQTLLEWSSRSSKHSEKACADLWKSMTFRQDGTHVGAGTLRVLSKASNLERYKEIQQGCLWSLLTVAASTQTPVDMARVVKKMYGETFVCVNPSKRIWYEFQGHSWVEAIDGMSIRSHFSNEVARQFAERASYYSIQRDRVGDPESEEYKKLDLLRDMFEKVRLKLMMTSFKENVLKECAELFFNCEFMKRIDENPKLLACSNGVWDMSTLSFRPGKPDDYCAKNTRQPYDETPWTEQPYAAELTKFLEDVYPVPEVREYVLDILARCLRGENQQKIYVMTGKGANGKSAADILMAFVLGDYNVELSVQIFTQKRGHSGNASPEFMKLHGARRASAEEPEKGVEMNISQVKALTGKIQARNLYDRDIKEFEMQATIFLNCNIRPHVDPKDEGIWRRLMNIFHPTKFCYDWEFDETNPFHRHRDDDVYNIKTRLWAPTMLALLIQRYKDKKGYERAPEPPACVMEYTAEYQKAFDGARQFVSTMLTTEAPTTTDGETGGANEANEMVLEKGALRPTFQSWKQDHPEFHGVSMDAVIDQITKEYGEPVKVGRRLAWRGLRIVDD